MKRKRSSNDENEDQPPIKRAKLERTQTEEVGDDEVIKISRECSDLGLDGLESVLSSSGSKQLQKVLSRRSSLLEEPNTPRIIKSDSFIRTSSGMQLEVDAQSSRTHVDQIPVEIWVQIMEYMDDPERLHMASTSARYWYIFHDFVGYGRFILGRHSIPVYDGVHFDVQYANGEPVREIGQTIESEKYEIIQYVPNNDRQRFGSSVVIYHPTKQREPEMSFPSSLEGKVKDTNSLIIALCNWPHYSNDMHEIERILVKNYSTLRIKFQVGSGENVRFQADIDLKQDCDEDLLKVCAQSQITQMNKSIIWPRSNNTNCPPAAQPDSLSLKLKDYQKRCLHWMKNVEAGCAQGVQYEYDLMMEFPACKKTVIANHESVMRGYSPHLEIVVESSAIASLKDQVNYRFTTRGGILADEMGLGKTVSVIALILANPRALDSSSTLHRDPLEFETTATLVLCPNQIVKQWEEEIKKHSNLNVLKIATIRDLRKLSTNDILDADVVVVSHQFLTNANYMAIPERTPITEETMGPKLHHIGWHRIVLDEAHELLTKRDKHGSIILNMDDVNLFQCNFKWYVSGTPFARAYYSYTTAMEWLGMNTFNSKGQPFSQYGCGYKVNAGDFCMARTFKNTLYWRNTKETVQEQMNIPDFIEDIQYVKLSSVEKMLYEAAATANHTLSMRAACTQPVNTKLIQKLSSLHPKAKYKVLHWPKELVTLCHKEIESNKAQLEELKKRNTSDIAYHRAMELARINQIERTIAEYVGYLKVVQQYKAPKLEWFDRDVPESFSKSKNAVVYHGSKIAHVLAHLEKLIAENESAKIILFSKTNDFLDLLLLCLEDFTTIPASACVRCVGNVHTRTKAIRDFNDVMNKVNIILLSLSDTASGTHLAVASHIVLVDAVSGDKNEAFATDAQAIARAHRFGQDMVVRVVRFIVPHSIEQIEYENVYGILANVPPRGWDEQ